MFSGRRLICGSDRVSVQCERKHSCLAFLTRLSFSTSLLCVRGASCYLWEVGSDQHCCIPLSLSLFREWKERLYHHQNRHTDIHIWACLGNFHFTIIIMIITAIPYFSPSAFYSSVITFPSSTRSQLWKWNQWMWVRPLPQWSHLPWPDWPVLLWVSVRVRRHQLWGWCWWVCQWALPEWWCLPWHGEQVGWLKWWREIHLCSLCKVELGCMCCSITCSARSLLSLSASHLFSHNVVNKPR